MGHHLIVNAPHVYTTKQRTPAGLITSAKREPTKLENVEAGKTSHSWKNLKLHPNWLQLQVLER
jgi:hypothetical protein